VFVNHSRPSRSPKPDSAHHTSTGSKTIDRSYIEALIQLSLRGLEGMYDAHRNALFSFDYSSGSPHRVEHLGMRYTVMSALGIFEAKEAGFETFLDPAALLRNGVEQHQGNDIDHLAMALWADGKIKCGISQDVLPKLKIALSQPNERKIGRVMAWALTALSLYSEENSDPQVRVLADEIFEECLQGAWCADGGLFRHYAHAGRTLRGMSLFSTQIYWVYALATYGRIFDNKQAVEMAETCADKLISMRDAYYGWPWRYDAEGGRVAEQYPVYAVHQDAMAPMALHALGDANGRSYAQINRESMSWLHHNQLGMDMVAPEHNTIYRAIRRRFPFNRAAIQVGRLCAFANQNSPTIDKPWFLRLNATCRPYHLGWILHAWASRLDHVDDLA
jgi:hypothetical protein